VEKNKLFTFIAIFFFCGLSFAQENEEPKLWEYLDMGGYTRGEAHIPISTTQDKSVYLADTTELKVKSRFGKTISGFAALRGRFDELNEDAEADFDCREGYLMFRGRWLDITFGQQIIPWGKADAINPTDNLCARDKTIFSSEPDDQRLGSLAAKIDAYFGDFTITGVWQPILKDSKFLIPPMEDFEYMIPENFRPEDIKIKDPVLPARNISNSALALKCSATLRRIDLSASYFYGYSTYPDFILGKIVYEPETEVEVLPVFNRIHVIGGDFSFVIDPFIIRGEGAYTIVKRPKTLEIRQLRQSYLHWILGLEWECTEDMVISPQYSMIYIPDYKPIEQEPEYPYLRVARANRTLHRQDRPYTHIVTLRADYRFVQKTLLLQFKGIFFVGNREYRIRPRIVYDINDHFQVTTAADIFFGPKKSKFWMYSRHFSRLFLELKYSF